MKRPSRLNSIYVISPSVEVHLVVYIIDNVLVSGVEEIIRMKFVLYAAMKLKIHSLMIQIRILSLILKIFLTTLHNLLGLKRLHGFLEVIAALVHNGNYAK
ncbi:hypothetical protein Tco_0986760, partial [Tanacetum coccineum]